MRIGVLTITAIAALTLSGCGGSGDAAAKKTKQQPKKISSHINEAMVRKLADQTVWHVSSCPYGEWSHDGWYIVDKPYKQQLKSRAELNCYDKKGELLPRQAGQVSYLEFDTPAHADAYAAYALKASEASFPIAWLVDENRVAIFLQSKAAYNRTQFMKNLQAQCGCGKITETPA